MKLTILLLLNILFLIPNVSAQSSNLETQKLAVDTLFRSDKEEALRICEDQIPLALAAKDTIYITYFLDQAGELNRQAGNYDRAITQLSRCLTYKVDWHDLKDLSITHNNLGRTYGQKGIYEQAIFHFLEALKLMETAENILGQSFYLNNLGAMYDLQHNYTKSIDCYERSLALKKQLGDQFGAAASYTNLGITYFNLAEYEKSMSFHQRAYDIYKQGTDQNKIARTLNNMGEIHIARANSDQALSKLNQAYEMDSILTDQKLRMSIICNLARAYFISGQMVQAEGKLAMVEQMATAANAYSLLALVYDLKSKMAQKTGLENQNPEILNLAIDYLNTSMAYKDSMVNEVSIRASAEMQGKYEYEKNLRIIRENELAISQREETIKQARLRMVFWISSTVILVLVAVALLILYFLKQKNTHLLNGQLALIAAQNSKLKSVNDLFRSQLDRTKISLAEKEELLENVFTKSTSTDLPEQLLGLSKREMEVLSYLALGWSDDLLAEKLFISKTTVKTHLRRIYSKLLVRGRAEAVAVAHKYQLLGGYVTS